MKYKRFSAFSAMLMLTTILAGCNNSESSGIFPNNSLSESSSSSVFSTTSSSSSSEVSLSKTESNSTTVSESSSSESSSNGSESSFASTPVMESGDVFCFEFSIDGESYKFPLLYSDMEKNGWSYKSNAGIKAVKPNQYLIGIRIEKGDMSMSVQPINLTNGALTANEANIGKLTIDSFYIKPESHTVSYAGIVLGKSTADDVSAAFGKPSSTYESEKSPTVTYKMKTNVTVKFCFDNTKGGVVDKIEIQNFSKN
ncbi:MAG: hypothetical protein ACI4JZ_09240 [Oscillospiraceae bacterium]